MILVCFYSLHALATCSKKDNNIFDPQGCYKDKVLHYKRLYILSFIQMDGTIVVISRAKETGDSDSGEELAGLLPCSLLAKGLPSDFCSDAT